MAAVGYLSDVEFTVSDDVVRTLDNVKWGGSARYETHALVDGDTLTEFVGREIDSFTFDITLLAQLGVSPIDDIAKLFGYMRNGTTLPLVLGDHAYGRYRWTITKLNTAVQHFDAYGNMYAAKVSVTLQEYLKR